MAKEMTHIGKLFSRHSNHLRKLRETPKFWTDGDLKWSKFDKQGKPNKTVCANSTKHSGFRYLLLDLTSIRPLTLEEKREPFQRALDYITKKVEHLEEELKRIETALIEAKERKEQDSKALTRFDKEHGIEVANEPHSESNNS